MDATRMKYQTGNYYSGNINNDDFRLVLIKEFDSIFVLIFVQKFVQKGEQNVNHYNF